MKTVMILFTILFPLVWFIYYSINPYLKYNIKSGRYIPYFEVVTFLIGVFLFLFFGMLLDYVLQI